jgi:periplasmic divalent cation tolerance protein
MCDSDTLVMVQTTMATEEQAERMAQAIVGARLAACVQRESIRSVYRWKGRVESAGEFRLTAKTRAALAPRLMEFIRQSHPYELPELVVLPILDLTAAYRDWIRAETDDSALKP